MYLSRAFFAFAIMWIVAMSWRLYPQFGDTLKIDGRLMRLETYVEERCGQRIGPAAESCLDEARATGQRLVAREQGKSLLLIEAPLLGWLLVYLPRRYGLTRLGRRDADGIGDTGRGARVE